MLVRSEVVVAKLKLSPGARGTAWVKSPLVAGSSAMATVVTSGADTVMPTGSLPHRVT